MLLTKSRYLTGLQCPKLLWIQSNAKEEIPQPNQSQENLFKTGSEVGILATQLFPDGISLPTDFKDNLNQTKENLNKTLFEAGFLTNNLYARVDILVPNKDKHDIVEVKSSTEVKEINLHDVSFQKHVLEKAGIKVNRCYIMHINNKYVRQGEIDTEKFFTKVDITEEVKVIEKDIEERIQTMKNIINKERPDIDIHPGCKKPYDCPLIPICWNHIKENSVFDLIRGGKKSWDLYYKNIKEIKDIPEDIKLTKNQQIQKENRVHIDKEQIKQFIDTLEYPIYFFDFETINPAIPLYDGLRPYQRLPFQYSLHIQKEPNSTPTHISFLADEKEDPRETILISMKQNLGDKGTILAWNQSFEIGVIRELTSEKEEYKEWSENIIERFNDLMIPFKNMSYYNPIQRGSSSIKKVLPALTDLNYKDLDINNGADASIAFENLIKQNHTKEEIQTIRTSLEKYCELDTLAEIKILEGLYKII